MLKKILFLISFACVNSCFGQEIRQYAFTRYSTLNGLLTNTIHSIAQDKEGFIWLAGSHGLQRFDGTNFITFKSQKDRPGTLPEDHLIRLHMDRDSNLWVISRNYRLGIFDTHRFTFKEVTLNTGKPKNLFEVVTFFQTPEGIFYNEGSGALYRYSKMTGSFSRADSDIPFPPKWKRLSLSYDEEQNGVWMTSDSGIAWFNLKTKILNYRGHNPENDPVITAMSKDYMLLGTYGLKGRWVYFTSWPVGSGVPNLIAIDKQTGELKRHKLNEKIGLTYHEIGGVLQQRNGRVWTFGKSFFTEIVNDASDFVVVPNEYNNEQSIRFDNVTSIFEDKSGNIWFGTDNGVFLFNPDAQHFHVYNIERPETKIAFEAAVQAVLEMDDGNFLVGTWGRGLYMYDKNFKPLTLPKALQERMDVLSVWDMHKHSKTGKIWIVMQAGGIIVYDPRTQTKVSIEPESFQLRTIRKVVEDKQGNLWFGSQGGRIVKWDLLASGGSPIQGYSVVQTSGAAYKLFIDKQGFLWVATMAHGLLKIDPATGKILKNFNKEGKDGGALFNNFPTDIVQYDDTTIMVTAGCINIINTKTNSISYFGTEEGLPSNNAQCIEIDQAGILWVGMENGLCRVNFIKKIVNSYDRRDGITFDNFGPAGCKMLSGGRLVFTNDHNFMVFDPAKLVPPGTAGKPLISYFKLSGKALLVDSLFKKESVELDYDNTSFEIIFTGLTFLKQNSLHFYYMLDGADKNWILADGSNKAVYNYLAPGDYVFKLKAVNNNGIESEIRELKISVSPPFWKSWWFLGLCMLTVLGVLFWIDRERMNRLKEVQQTRASIAGNLHEDVQTTLNNINILSEMAKMKIDKDILRSKEYIEQISEKSHNIIIAMDDMLWSIDPGNDAMDQTLLRTKEFIDALQSRYEARISLAVDPKIMSLELDMKVRHEFFLMLKMILRLITEDASGKELQLNIDHFRSKIVLKVRGENVALNVNHPAIAQKTDDIKKRAASVKAVLDIQNDPKGISVILIVRL